MVFFIILIVIVTVVVLVILSNSGVFRKAAKCGYCGNMVDGPQQTILETNEEVLCPNCAKRIHPQIKEYAKENWNLQDYSNYITWDDDTREERSRFQPDCTYGRVDKLALDTERGLFMISRNNDGLVLRIRDLFDYDFNFRPDKVEDKLLSNTVFGTEYMTADFSFPKIFIEGTLDECVQLDAKKKGVISPKYEYELRTGFLDIIRAFSICGYIIFQRMEDSNNQTSRDIGEIEKALALFMFDSMDEVTEETLKQQRNALIKAFHPDNNDTNEGYSQKINDAYELLKGLINK
ncbi:MAG: hypothetical protein K5644_08385 [Lachnospiraceae bacterium]|nr:hypothetical protein [Lachnospiraceae bacterium]